MQFVFLPPAAEAVAVVMSMRLRRVVMIRISLRKVRFTPIFGLVVKDRDVFRPHGGTVACLIRLNAV